MRTLTARIAAIAWRPPGYRTTPHIMIIVEIFQTIKVLEALERKYEHTIINHIIISLQHHQPNMTFRITVLPASSKAGKETIRNLLESDAKPSIHGIYRDISKVPVEFANHERFEATQGDVAGTGLDFSRSDAVFYVPPPTYDGTDQGEFGVRTASNVKDALGKAPNVKKLLLFSSMGSQYDHSIVSLVQEHQAPGSIKLTSKGLLRLNHITDNILKDTVPEVVIVKPGYFQENWSHAFESIQADPPVICSVVTPLDHKIPMVVLHFSPRLSQIQVH